MLKSAKKANFLDRRQPTEMLLLFKNIKSGYFSNIYCERIGNKIFIPSNTFISYEIVALHIFKCIICIHQDFKWL